MEWAFSNIVSSNILEETVCFCWTLLVMLPPFFLVKGLL